MALPKIAQIYEHRLNVLKGWPNIQGTVDLAVEADTSVTIVPGMICHINPATGKAALGCPASTIPLYCILTGNRAIDTDSYRYEGGFASASHVDATYGALQDGAKCGFLVGNYPIEAETTELASTLVSGAVVQNAPLYSPTSTADAGKILVGVVGVNPIFGFAIKVGIYNDAHGTKVVRFINQPGVTL